MNKYTRVLASVVLVTTWSITAAAAEQGWEKLSQDAFLASTHKEYERAARFYQAALNSLPEDFELDAQYELKLGLVSANLHCGKHKEADLMLRDIEPKLAAHAWSDPLFPARYWRRRSALEFEQNKIEQAVISYCRSVKVIEQNFSANSKHAVECRVHLIDLCHTVLQKKGLPDSAPVKSMIDELESIHFPEFNLHHYRQAICQKYLSSISELFESDNFRLARERLQLVFELKADLPSCTQILLKEIAGNRPTSNGDVYDVLCRTRFPDSKQGKLAQELLLTHFFLQQAHEPQAIHHLSNALLLLPEVKADCASHLVQLCLTSPSLVTAMKPPIRELYEKVLWTCHKNNDQLKDAWTGQQLHIALLLLNQHFKHVEELKERADRDVSDLCSARQMILSISRHKPESVQLIIQWLRLLDLTNDEELCHQLVTDIEKFSAKTGSDVYLGRALLLVLGYYKLHKPVQAKEIFDSVPMKRLKSVREPPVCMLRAVCALRLLSDAAKIRRNQQSPAVCKQMLFESIDLSGSIHGSNLTKPEQCALQTRPLALLQLADLLLQEGNNAQAIAFLSMTDVDRLQLAADRWKQFYRRLVWQLQKMAPNNSSILELINRSKRLGPLHADPPQALQPKPATSKI